MILVAHGRIRANRWQTRRAVDEVSVRELAVDISARYWSRIATRGLLQVPAGRLVDAEGEWVRDGWGKDDIPLFGDVTADLERRGWFVELAFGHSRQAAFSLLAEGDGEGFEANPEFEAFPVEPVNFSDEEMAIAAWSENAQRNDLTAIEEAEAIRQRMESFGWTQGEVAEQLGLSRSTVANKLRLLGLNDEVRGLVLGRKLSERQTMAMIPALTLPAPALRKAVDNPWLDPGDMVKQAVGGESSDDLRRRANRIVEQTTLTFERCPFPVEQAFDGLEGVRAARCDGCEMRVRYKGELRCPDEECWVLKAAAWGAAQVAGAVEATGIPAYEGDPERMYYTTERFYGYDDRALAREILEEGCSHGRLRLQFEPGGGGMYLEDFEGVRMVCEHGEGEHCKCLAAKRAARTREQKANDPELQKKRERERRVRKLVGPANEALAAALGEGHKGAWLKLLARLGGKGQEEWEMERIVEGIAKAMVRPCWQYYTDRPDQARASLVRFFDEVGLELPWGEESPLARVLVKVERITGWVDGLVHGGPPTVEAVEGNLENLRKLAGELEGLEASEELEACAGEVARLREILTDVRTVVEGWDGIEDGEEWVQHGSWLVWGEPGDGLFEEHLEQVTRPAVIEYAAAVVGNKAGEDGRFRALSNRLRLLESPEDGNERRRGTMDNGGAEGTKGKTHKQLADELDVPVSAVAIVREVLRGSSAESQKALEEAGGDVAGAARGLAERRRCEGVATAITSELVEMVEKGE